MERICTDTLHLLFYVCPSNAGVPFHLCFGLLVQIFDQLGQSVHGLLLVAAVGDQRHGRALIAALNAQGTAYGGRQAAAHIFNADVGVLSHGFPRESMLAVEIGGVRTNFRMPDIISIGLGGGSIVRQHEDGTVTVGPDSVGYRVTKEALCFGGHTLTATDIVVAAGAAEGVGDPALVADLDPELVKKARAVMTEMVENCVDRMKTSAGDIDVILVGGGSILVPSELEGVARVLKPNNFGEANAVGSAISQVSGRIERVFSLDKLGRAETLEVAKGLATEEAIKAGADPDSIQIVEVEDVPLAYLPGNATRVRVKAVGDLKI